jgi:TolB-like protein/Flp pilus assembly protein TadD
MSFYAELKRRNVIRVGAAYAVAAWLLIQIADTTLPLFGFDQTRARLVVILLAIGFIPALIFAWAFELTPSGLQRDEGVDPSLKITTGAAKRLDRIIMVILVLALGLFAFDKFVLSESRERAIVENARVEAFAEAVEAYKKNKSIAVLPFVDMSPTQDQEYFGDGIAEELLDQLTTLDGLNVASRTSSFAFKGSDASAKYIGEELGVTSVLEGSVRKEGDNLRVTAQLIDARTDTHLWSETFDRKFSDIFFIQEEIAQEVAAALSIALDIEARNHLPGAGTTKIEAYDAYLAGRAWRRIAQAKHAEPYFQRAVEIDPNYADAWNALGGAISMKSDEYPSDEARVLIERGREMVLHAIELNPELASAWGRLSAHNRVLGDWSEAVEAGQKAAELAPGNIMAQLTSAGLFGALGHTREANLVAELAQEVRPLSYGGAQVLAEQYIQARRYDDARATLEISESLSATVKPGVIKRRLFIALSERKPADIRKFLGQFADVKPEAGPMIQLVLEEFESPPAEIVRVLRRYFDEENEMPGQGRVIMAGLATYYGDPEFALVVMKDELARNLFRFRRIWYPFFSDMRKLDGFADFVTALGLEEFYRTYDWPDYCRPLGDDDFECF